MFVRFVVRQRLGKSKHASGLFMAAARLRDHGELAPEERERLEALLEWFRLNLPVPPAGSRDVRAIYWYRPSAKEPIGKMWELAQLLESHDYQVEKITTDFPGLVIYRDEFQIGAIPHVDRHR